MNIHTVHHKQKKKTICVLVKVNANILSLQLHAHQTKMHANILSLQLQAHKTKMHSCPELLFYQRKKTVLCTIIPNVQNSNVKQFDCKKDEDLHLIFDT